MTLWRTPSILMALAFGLLAVAPAFAQGWLPQTCPVQSDLRGVDMLDPSTGWIVGSGGAILHTTDGGALWSTQDSHAGYMLRGVSFLDFSFGIATGDGGTILRTTDGGTNWQVIRTDWMDVLRSVRVLDELHACAVGTNAIFQPFTARSTDGGITWSFGSFYIQGNEGGLTDVDFVDTQNGFASAYLWDGRGAICRTTNGGANWSVVTVVSSALYGIDFASAQVGVAAGLDGFVLRSIDGGLTWSPRSIGIARDLAAVSFPTGTTGWVVGEAGFIARTTDGGANWTQQTGGGASWLRDIECVSPLIGTLAGDGSTIRRTTTGGEEGATVSDGSEVAVHSVAPNPFTRGTSIALLAPAGIPTAVSICDPAGRRVRTLGVPREAIGLQTIWWDGRDDQGRETAAGIYLIRVEGSSVRAVERVVRVR